VEWWITDNGMCAGNFFFISFKTKAMSYGWVAAKGNGGCG